MVGHGWVKTGQVGDDDRRSGGTPEASSAHLLVSFSYT
jgi:hypothetical protein